MTDARQSGLLSPEEVEDARQKATLLMEGLNQVLIGQGSVIESTCIGLLARGHILLEGLPGLGKTELVKGLGRLLGLSFTRIQFTPDLLPADITGSYILENTPEGTRDFRFRKGPIFGNLVLADEINRASPKTQAALLEAMQEHRVTLLGTTHELPSPFFVLATQNPIELEGTYPLPEAQLDRFLFKINIGEPSPETLHRILLERQRGEPPTLTAALTLDELSSMFEAVDRVHLPTAVAHYISRLVHNTHPGNKNATDMVRRLVRYGSSPRAAIGIANAGRAAAILAGKPNVGFEEIKRVATAILRHRLVLTYEAALERVDADQVVAAVLAATDELSEIPRTVDQ